MAVAKPAHAARRPKLRREMEALCFSGIVAGIIQSRTPLPFGTGYATEGAPADSEGMLDYKRMVMPAGLARSRMTASVSFSRIGSEKGTANIRIYLESGGCRMISTTIGRR